MSATVSELVLKNIISALGCQAIFMSFNRLQQFFSDFMCNLRIGTDVAIFV